MCHVQPNGNTLATSLVRHTDNLMAIMRHLIILSSIFVVLCGRPPEPETQNAANTKPMLCTVEERDAPFFNPATVPNALNFTYDRYPQAENFSVRRICVPPENIFDFVHEGCSNLNQLCAAVITLGSCPFVTALNKWTAKYSIPHLISYTDENNCQISSPNSIQLIPAGQIKSDLIEQLIKKVWKWKELVLIYDDMLELRDLSRLLLDLSSISVSTGLVNLKNGLTKQHISTLLNAMKKLHRGFLVVTSDKLDIIMDYANSGGLLGTDCEWIVMSNTTCRNFFNKTIFHGSSVLYLRMTHEMRKPRHEFCDNNKAQLSATDTQTQLLALGLEALMRAIVIENMPVKMEETGEGSLCSKKLESSRKKVIKCIKGLTIETVKGDVTFDLSTGKISSYGFDFCSADDSSRHGYGMVGSWHLAKGLESNSNLFRNSFRDFEGKTLRVGGQEAPPFIMKRLDGNESFYVGFSIELLTELARRLNFSYEIVEPEDRLWGAPDENGTWNGVVGMVTRGEVEFGVGPLTITAIRETVVDFTIPYYEDGIGILTKRPELDSQAMFRLFSSLQPAVWACLVASTGATCIVLYLISCSSPISGRRRGQISQHRLTIFACTWAIIGSVLEQGADVHPITSSGRLILGCWWLFTIILVSTYTANMAAVLTITIYDKPINSLTELASQTDMKPLVKESSNIHTLFKEATNEIYMDIWHMMRSMPLVRNNEEALTYVRSGNTAYMTDRSQLEYILLNDCETYALADDVFNTGGMGFVAPDNAAFLDSFDSIIMKLQESGIIDGWRRQWWSSNENKCNSHDHFSSVKQLDLQYLAGPFFIFLGAMLFSVFVVIVERVYRSNTNRCKQCKRMINSHTDCRIELTTTVSNNKA